MKASTLTCCVVLSLSIGCNSPTEPSAAPGPPSSSPSPTTNISGNVYAEAENNCPPEAFVEVLDGPKAGLKVTQDYKTCVEEGNGWVSFNIDGLPTGIDVKLRASAPGYQPEERIVTPSGGPERFVLKKQ